MGERGLMINMYRKQTTEKELGSGLSSPLYLQCQMQEGQTPPPCLLFAQRVPVQVTGFDIEKGSSQ
jgi:hypothetical protein